MRTFFVRFLLIGAPFWLLSIIYFICDPFRIIYQYDGYYKNNPIGVNREFAGTELFLKKYKTLKYNSFIFGSSRSLAFQPDSWAKYLESSAHPYIFDASGENIYGIHAKIKLIDQLGVNLKHALVVLDCNGTFANTKASFNGILGTNHPIYTGQSKVMFQLNGLTSFFDFPLMSSYITYRLFEVQLPYPKKYIETNGLFVSDTTNILIKTIREKEINEDTENYYKRREAIFATQAQLRKSKTFGINNDALELLKDIRIIFDKQKTDYQIVIGPAYSQQVYAPEDLQKLYDTFGKERIHDYSGVNEITSNKYNYYENSHFRPHIGDSIMRQIYKNKE